MLEWHENPNKKTLLIIRRSGYGQKENTSGETQLRELLEYSKRHGLTVVYQESIIETAFKRKERKKFRALIQRALKENIQHVLFFWSSREARNLTDLEENDELIKSGRLIIHHVAEGKVYWRGTPDSEFTFRELNAVINKSESRSKSTMLKAALKTKALAGWVPYRHLPLGYIHSKDRDKFGNPIKGTAKVIRHPDIQRVRTVQREFELRAQGFSYDEIRKRNLAEPGLVPDEIRHTYSRHAIEVRLKNPIYWGYFYLKDDPKRYEGKHELIIPDNILRAVEQVNSGNFKGRRNIGIGDDLFRGWLTCDDPECGLLITYERKEKTLKSTGEAKVYHLYRCTNSRKVHERKVYVGEEALFEQFAPVVQRFSITKEFAQDITNALGEALETQRKAIRKQMEGFRLALKELEGKEDIIYEHFVAGVLDKEAYQRQVNKVRAERTDYAHQLEQLTLQINDASNSALAKVFELAVDAELQWKLKNREERAEYLKRVLSNGSSRLVVECGELRNAG